MRRPGFLGASLGLGSLFGVPIRLHLTFFILLAWLGWRALTQGAAGVAGLLWILLLFSFVVLHELGHALMARACGVATREIVLLPIGGLARLERMPSGLSELLIALAGPAVNLGLGLAFMIAGVLLFDVPVDLGSAGAALSPALLMWGATLTNFALMAFNLLPAFPMDGGRVLRALLTLAMPLDRATRWAARVGQAVAIAFVLLGLTGGNPILVLIGAMVFIGAANESLFQTSRSRVTGRLAKEAMVTRFEAVAPQDSLGHAAELLLQTEQTVFPVVDAWGRPAGALTRSALLAGLERGGADSAVLEIMIREVPLVAPEAPLESVLDLLQNAARLPVFVVEEERLVGMVTSENLGEMMEIRRALGAEASEG
ncbi:MAG: site-2 protease family protein [Thermoanaerobaculia bacterium]|nr:site-2 protease family protein [Thermoanaerobaculia bacterium]